MATKTTPETLATQRKNLYSQILAESQRIASQQAQQSRQSLQQQLAQQRLSQQQARAQVSEQGYMQQRQISQQAASRGLGSSGLRNLAGLQSQMAQSGAINQLAQQDTQVQKEAMLTNRNINQSMADQLRNAQLQYGQMNVEADENLYNRQQAEEQQRSDFLMQLAQIAAEGGDSKLIQDLITLQDPNMMEKLSPEQQGVVGGLGSETDAADISQLKSSSRFGISNLLEAIANYNPVGLAVRGVTAGLTGSKFSDVKYTEQKLTEEFSKLFYGKDKIQAMDYDPLDGQRRNYNYTINGKEYNFRTSKHVEDFITSRYLNKQNFKAMSVKVDPDGKVWFKVGEKQFTNYRDANNYVLASK